jgi:hypothetical protein
MTKITLSFFTVRGFGVPDDNGRVGEQSVEHGMGPPFLGISTM